MTDKPDQTELVDADPDTWHLYLYVAGMTPTAERALANLEAICKSHLARRYTLNVVDLLDEPERAESEQILAVPTLVRGLPLPVRKIVGDLSNTKRALQGLGLQSPLNS